MFNKDKPQIDFAFMLGRFSRFRWQIFGSPQTLIKESQNWKQKLKST